MPLPVAPLAPPDAVQAPAPPPNEPEIPEIQNHRRWNAHQVLKFQLNLYCLSNQYNHNCLDTALVYTIHLVNGGRSEIHLHQCQMNQDDELAELVDPDCAMDFKKLSLSTLAGGTEPRTYSQAMKGPDAEHWKRTAIEEINAHMQNGTWRLSDFHLARKQLALDGSGRSNSGPMGQ